MTHISFILHSLKDVSCGLVMLHRSVIHSLKGDANSLNLWLFNSRCCNCPQCLTQQYTTKRFLAGMILITQGDSNYVQILAMENRLLATSLKSAEKLGCNKTLVSIGKN